MSLDDRQIALVRDSFKRVGPDTGNLHRQFYEAFFRRAPELKEMFREDISNQGMTFMRTLRTILDNIDAPDVLKPRYAELGTGHKALGVHRDHFPIMEEALIETIAGAMGEEWTDELEAAWRAAYREIASRMVASGGID